MEQAIIHELAVTRAPVADLHTYHRNPRQGNIDVIRTSLAVNGQYRPVVVNRGTYTGRPGEVLAGNHTLLAARDAGWHDIAACWVDVDEDHAARIVAADNRTADLGDYDEQLLAELLTDLSDLEGTGYDDHDLARLVADLGGDAEPVDGHGDPDEAPDTPQEPLSAPGDVYDLGPHRLVVGDATQPGVWDTLLDGRAADLVWTDPPYGVSYVGKTKDALRIENDGPDDDAQLLSAVFGLTIKHTAPGACWYVAAPSGPAFHEFGTVLRDLGVWRQTLAWVKDQFVLGHSDYHYRHESVLYGWSPDGPHHAVPDRTQDTVHEVPRPKASTDHPTMKPVELIERHIANSTDPGQLVVDPFGGSGSTLIAAHRRHRVAALIELDPRYADVICRRFEEFTDTVPIHVGSGQPRSFRR